MPPLRFDGGSTAIISKILESALNVIVTTRAITFMLDFGSILVGDASFAATYSLPAAKYTKRVSSFWFSKQSSGSVASI